MKQNNDISVGTYLAFGKSEERIMNSKKYRCYTSDVGAGLVSARGITLISLVITIIVLLILAGVALTLIIGQNGIINNAKTSKETYGKSQALEELKLKVSEVQIDKQGSATLQDVVNALNSDKKNEYIISSTQINNISGNIPDISNANEIYVIYKNYQFKIDCNLIVTFVDNYSVLTPETNSVNIYFDGNGGKLSNSNGNYSIKVPQNTTYTLPENTFENTMYDFNCWLDEDGKEYLPGTEYTVSENDIKFIAKWEYKVQEELTYLRATGNQYIDTGYTPNQDTSVEIQFQLLSRKSQFIYGSRVGQIEKEYALAYENSDLFEGLRSDYQNDQSHIITYGYNDIQTIKKAKNEVYVNNSLIYTHSYSNFSTAINEKNNNMLLFNTNTNGSVNNSFCADLKFYYCKIWDGDTLVRDYVPVIDNNGIVCLLDKVEQKLYYAKYGEIQEEFEKDTQITKLNSIACNGKQYIDTEFKPNQDTSVELKCVINNSTNQFLFGSRTDLREKTFSACFTANAPSSIRFDYNTIQTSYSGYSVGNTYIIKQEKNKFYINGSLKGSTTYNSFTGDYNLYLLGVNTSGTVSPLKSYIYFYYCKIWDGDTLVRDYIPVVDNNSVICLYDKINSECYYSKDSDFILGK